MHSIELSTGHHWFTSDEIEQAHAWIADCEWSDLDADDELSDAEVVRGVARHYDGGWEQFLADGAY